jgi:hypothetical protein
MVQGLKIAETFAKLQGIELKARELVDEWILITYDIPVTEKGTEARIKFLKEAPKIGAMMHSRSVYLMPNTQQAQLAAVELSKTVGGEVYIWTSKAGAEQAKMITAFYDRKIQEQIENLKIRNEKENILIKDEKLGMAERMHRKTANLFNQVLFTVAQRGATTEVLEELMKLEKIIIGDKEEKNN